MVSYYHIHHEEELGLTEIQCKIIAQNKKMLTDFSRQMDIYKVFHSGFQPLNRRLFLGWKKHGRRGCVYTSINSVVSRLLQQLSIFFCLVCDIQRKMFSCYCYREEELFVVWILNRQHHTVNGTSEQILRFVLFFSTSVIFYCITVA